MVMAVLAILAGVAIPSLAGLGRTREDAGATRIRSALIHAQTWAMDAGTFTWVEFHAGHDTVTAYRDSGAAAPGAAVTAPAVPDLSGRVPLPDPLTRTDLLFDLGAAGLDVTTIDLGGGREVMFDLLGRPHRRNGQPFTQDGTIQLAGGPVVRIARTTGLVTIE